MPRAVAAHAAHTHATLAGLGGRTQSLIVASHFRPELVSIASAYRLFELCAPDGATVASLGADGAITFAAADGEVGVGVG